VVRVHNVKTGSKELVSGSDGAELAAACRVRVGEIAACISYVILHVGPASLTRRRLQGYQLNGRACNRLFSDS
jgi:hypothetical protein